MKNVYYRYVLLERLDEWHLCLCFESARKRRRPFGKEGEILHEILHVLEHTLTDTLRLAPLLFLAYLAMEYLEHKAGEKVLMTLSEFEEKYK